MKNLLFAILSFCFPLTLISQVTSLEYLLEYDEEEEIYIANIVITAGTFPLFNTFQYTQANSQYSIVTSPGIEIEVDTFFNPIRSTDYAPVKWNNVLTLLSSSSGLPQDYYSFVPVLSPLGFLPSNMQLGDTIPLFSFKTLNSTKCDAGIRLWHNETDPSSSDPGMAGQQFDNGYTIGSLTQLYAENAREYAIHTPLEGKCIGHGHLTYTQQACNKPDSIHTYFGELNTACFSNTPCSPSSPTLWMPIEIDDPEATTLTTQVTAQGFQALWSIYRMEGECDSLVLVEEFTGSAVFDHYCSGDDGNLTNEYVTQITENPEINSPYKYWIAVTGIGLSNNLEFQLSYSASKRKGIITGRDSMCVNGHSQLYPSTGGVWSSDDPSVATVTSDGLITAITPGICTFQFTPTVGTTCPYFPTEFFTVVENIDAGPDYTICNTDILTLSGITPSNGEWSPSPSNPAGLSSLEKLQNGKAEITFNSGAEGTYIFYYSIGSGCTDSISVDVAPVPNIFLEGPSAICVDENSAISSDVPGGVWIPDDNAIVTLTNSGIITGISPGITTIKYISPDGCEVVSDRIYVDATFFEDNTDLCVGDSRQILPSIGGSWVSSNPAVASVNNQGLITALSPGQATFVFTSGNTGCSFQPSEVLTVVEPPTGSVASSLLCISEQTQLLSNNDNGTWTFLNPEIAVILEDGITVEAISPGTASFIFQDTITKCMSDIVNVNVSVETTVGFTGPNQICINETTQLFPSTGGVWSSSDPTVASVNNSGFIVALSPGCVTFTFTDVSNGCNSLPTDFLCVDPTPNVELLGPSQLCIGETTFLSPTTGGTWYSSNESIATVSSIGTVTALNVGQVSFAFSQSDTNCISEEIVILVQDVVTLNLDNDHIVLGDSTAILTTSIEGTFSSSNTSVAIVENGFVYGVGEGTALITFVNEYNCVGQVEVTVLGGPAGPDQFVNCWETGATYMLAQGEGVWTEIQGFALTIDDPTNPTTKVSGFPQPGEYILQWTTPTGLYDNVIITVGDDCECFIEGNLIIPPPLIPYCDNDVLIIENDFAIPEGGLYVWEKSTSVNFENIDTIGFGRDLVYSSDIYNFQSGKNYVRRVYSEPTNFCSDTSNIICITTDTISNVIEIYGETEYCEGEEINLYMEGSCDPMWTGPAGFVVSGDSLNAASLPDGLYTAHSGCDGCQSQKSVFITTIQKPEISLSGPSEICIQGTTLLVTEIEGTWNTMDDGDINTTISTEGVVTGTVAGKDCFYLEDENGCISDTLCITVIDCPPPCNEDPSTTILSGMTYIDSNENGSRDSLEIGLDNISITVVETGETLLTDFDGTYQLTLPRGQYTLVASASVGHWISNTIEVVVDATDEPCVTDLDFGFILGQAPPEVEVIVYSPDRMRCDEVVQLSVQYLNLGTEPVSGTLRLVYDSLAEFTGLLDPDAMQIDNVIWWELDDIPPMQRRYLSISLQLPPATDPLPMLRYYVEFEHEEGILDIDDWRTPLRCSFDPNDKAMKPARPDLANKVLIDEEHMEYMIRFQNNGNDTAYSVTIVDVLDEHIDPATLSVIDASHPSLQTSIRGQEVIFTFDPILLVDSMTNYEESQGFVNFKCDVYPDTERGTLISNTADIIFDTNPPIVTNTVENQLVDDFCLDNINTSEQVTICDGDIYNGHTVSGIYTSAYESLLGCDSLHILTLNVISPQEENIELQLCPGEAAQFNGITYTDLGTYYDTTYTSTGCLDNLYEIEVIIFEPIEVIIDTTICEGESVLGITQSGNYEIEVAGESGCDSIYHVTLNVLAESDPLCINSSIEINKPKIKIYPNPNIGTFWIDAEEHITDLKIYNSIGMEVMYTSNRSQGLFEIEIKNKTPGVYLLKYNRDQSIFIEKIIISN